jgi:hypothetical protein
MTELEMLTLFIVIVVICNEEKERKLFVCSYYCLLCVFSFSNRLSYSYYCYCYLDEMKDKEERRGVLVTIEMGIPIRYNNSSGLIFMNFNSKSCSLLIISLVNFPSSHELALIFFVFSVSDSLFHLQTNFTSDFTI